MTTDLVPTQGLVPATWSADVVSAIDYLRGLGPGTFIEDELETEDGIATSQTTVITEHGPVLLTSWVPDADVPERHRIFVRQHLNRIRRRLNLGPITVRYFGPPVWAEGADVTVRRVNPDHPSFETTCEPGDQRMLGGSVSRRLPWTIQLNAALSGDGLIFTIAHEVRHVDQFWGRARVPEAEIERDAIAFAEGWMAAQ